MRKFIDVSKHQGNVNWEKAKNSKLFDFVILRCGYGNDEPRQDDSKWKRNVKECERLGINYGVYFYSYASTDNEVASEVQHCLRLLKDVGPHFKYPVFYDVEMNENGLFAKRAIQLFCSSISEAGYTVGVYTYNSFIKSWLKGDFLDKYITWVARYGSSKPDYSNTWSWQFSSNEAIPGITGRVDMSYVLDESKVSTITENVAPQAPASHIQFNYQVGQSYRVTNVNKYLNVRSSPSSINNKNLLGKSIVKGNRVINRATTRVNGDEIWMYIGTTKKFGKVYEMWVCADNGTEAYLVE